MNRENFKSRLGFILVSAGCAIGIGNVWKFPYVTGQNGGGIFVLFYLLFLFIMGVPVLTMELAVGRASRQSAVGGYKALEKPGHKWHIHGWFCIAGCYLLMMYYTTVSGWMLAYFWKYLTGTFTGMETGASGAYFSAMLASPVEMTTFMAVTVLGGFFVVSFGLQKGLERISKFMMLGLLGLIVVLAVNSCRLPGGGEGLAFYLLPSLSRAMDVGLASVITAAMNQSFFTLSLGIAAMEIMGSYMTREHTLTGEAVRICCLDTFVAISSGLIIFPACFAFGVQPDAGPSLIFVTLPNVFANMAGGRFWGMLFFLFMTFASFTTVISCSMAGRTLPKRSSVLIFRLVVLMQGCIPTHWPFSTSSSTKRRTAFSLSFIRPRTLQEPGVISRSFSIHSPLAKLSREEPICLLRSLVLNTLSPGVSSR